MIDMKKRLSAVVALSLLTAPVASTPFLYAPLVLAEESSATEAKPAEENKSETETSTAETVSEGGSALSEVIEKESVIIADSSVFYVQIGYEFEDGSFDEWARGTAFLVSNQDLLTAQSLADTSTTSNLYKAVLDKKADAYKTAGIDLKNEDEVEKHFVVRVTNSDGEQLKVKGSSVKNGLGLISLDKTLTSKPAIFEEEESVDSAEGAKYKMKIAGIASEKALISETEGTLVKPAANAAGGTLAMSADTSKGEAVGAPIYNDGGNIIGMVSGTGESLTVVPTNGLQTFLNGQGVAFDTRTSAEKKREAEAKAAEEKAIEEANRASVTTKDLEAAIKKAGAAKKSEYKKESFAALTTALKDAKDVLKSEDRSQAEVDSATKKLNDAYKNLEKYTLLDKLLIPGIIGIVAILGAVTTGIILAKRKKTRPALPKTKGGKPVVKPNDESDFSEELRRMDEADLMRQERRERVRPVYEEPVIQRRNSQGVYEEVDYGLDVTDQVAPPGLRTGNTNIPGVTFADESPEQPMNLAGQKYGVPLGGPGLLDEGDDETTILGKSAYLVRKDDGKQIPLRDGFIVGKERRKVHYCIAGNTSISRAHAQFRVIDGKFYVEDLSSKNYTYLNGNQLPAYKAAQLNDGDIVKMSDVEFVFHN